MGHYYLHKWEKNNYLQRHLAFTLFPTKKCTTWPPGGITCVKMQSARHSLAECRYGGQLFLYVPIYIRGRGKEAASISLTQQEPAGRPILLALLWFLF